MIEAIDIHAHYGDPECFPQKGLAKEFLKVSLEEVLRAYEEQNIAAGCFSPTEALFPACAEDVLCANARTAELALQHRPFYYWAVVDPLWPETFQQAEQLLREEKCLGIKIHPDGNGYHIRDHGDEIFAFCAEHRTVLLSHTGDANSLPEEFVPFADKYPAMTLIAAHVGCGCDGLIDHQIRAVQAAKNGNIYTDISSVKSIMHRIVEYAVEKISSEKILFGTDTPIHHIAMMKARAEYADVPEADKVNIFRGTALRLFPQIILK